MTELIDTHCHLYAEEFDTDREAVILRAQAAGVTRLLLPNIDADSINGLYKLTEQHPTYCLPMMGLHPTSVKGDYLDVLARIEKELHSRKFIGIGEIGLDYHWDTTYVKEQQQAFRTQLQWAKTMKLPVAIHTRKSTEDAIQIVREEQASHSLHGVLHCFSGTAEEAKQIMELGFYMGIGGVVTFKNGGLDKVLTDVPLDYLVIETDAPYLAPVPYRGKRNESAYLKEVVQKLAELYKTTEQDIAERTTANARKLFQLPEDKPAE